VFPRGFESRPYPMQFWGSKMSISEFHSLLSRLDSGEASGGRKKRVGKTGSDGNNNNSNSKEKTLMFHADVLRKMILVCLGSDLDGALGELVLDALKGGSGNFATEKTLRASYLLSHSTGWRLRHVGKGLGSPVHGSSFSSPSSSSSFSHGHDDKTNLDGESSREGNDDDVVEGSLSQPLVPMNQFSSDRDAARQAVRDESWDGQQGETKMRVEVGMKSPGRRSRSSKGSKSISPKAELGAEKQVLSFVSRGLLPHVHSEHDV
jgi:hypothetical protein